MLSSELEGKQGKIEIQSRYFILFIYYILYILYEEGSTYTHISLHLLHLILTIDQIYN